MCSLSAIRSRIKRKIFGLSANRSRTKSPAMKAGKRHWRSSVRRRITSISQYTFNRGKAASIIWKWKPRAQMTLLPGGLRAAWRASQSPEKVAETCRSLIGCSFRLWRSWRSSRSFCWFARNFTVRSFLLPGRSYSQRCCYIQAYVISNPTAGSSILKMTSSGIIRLSPA